MTISAFQFPTLPSKFPSKHPGSPRISSISFTSDQMYIHARMCACAAGFLKMVGSEGNQASTRLARGLRLGNGRKCKANYRVWVGRMFRCSHPGGPGMTRPPRRGSFQPPTRRG